MPTHSKNDYPILEAFVTGIRSLIATICWLVLSLFPPLLVFIPFLIALSCLSLGVLGWKTNGETIGSWLAKNPIRFFIIRK